MKLYFSDNEIKYIYIYFKIKRNEMKLLIIKLYDYCKYAICV